MLTEMSNWSWQIILLNNLLLLLLLLSLLMLGRCLRKLTVEGEKREDGDEVGGELVLLQPLLDWVEKWGWQNLKQSLKET